MPLLCSGLQGEEQLQVPVPSASVPRPPGSVTCAGWGSCTAHAELCCQALRRSWGSLGVSTQPRCCACPPQGTCSSPACLSVALSLCLSVCLPSHCAPSLARARLEAFSDHSGKLQVPLQEIIDWLGQKDEELSAQLPLRGDVLLVQQEKETHAVSSLCLPFAAVMGWGWAALPGTPAHTTASACTTPWLKGRAHLVLDNKPTLQPQATCSW